MLSTKYELMDVKSDNSAAHKKSHQQDITRDMSKSEGFPLDTSYQTPGRRDYITIKRAGQKVGINIWIQIRKELWTI